MTTTIDTQAPTPGPATPPNAEPKKPHTVAVVLSSILGLVGALVLLGGGALIVIHGAGRDDDGYYTSDTELVESSGYAITTDEIDLGADPVDVAPDDVVSSLRLRAEGASGEPLFLGVARTADVEKYLGGVDRSVVTDFGGGEVKLDDIAGARPAGAPAAQDIWAAEAEGSGRQTLEWEPESGSWSAVVMNADGERGVAADLDAGADIGWLIWVGIVLAAIGLAMTAAGGYGLFRSVR